MGSYEHNTFNALIKEAVVDIYEQIILLLFNGVQFYYKYFLPSEELQPP